MIVADVLVLGLSEPEKSTLVPDLAHRARDCEVLKYVMAMSETTKTKDNLACVGFDPTTSRYHIYEPGALPLC